MKSEVVENAKEWLSQCRKWDSMSDRISDGMRFERPRLTIVKKKLGTKTHSGKILWHYTVAFDCGHTHDLSTTPLKRRLLENIDLCSDCLKARANHASPKREAKKAIKRCRDNESTWADDKARCDAYDWAHRLLTEGLRGRYFRRGAP